jgi:hypothetical protein
MSRERWGTFAVNDHLRQRPFAVDVLLYDRLVIPYPPDSERPRWVAQGWRPDRLEACLEILGDLAIPVPWDEHKRDTFKTRYMAAQGADFDARNLAEAQQMNQDPFYLTRVLLSADFLPQLPRGVSKVWAVAAYPSANAYRKDYTSDARQERQETLGLVLTHRFLVPKAAGKSYRDFLKKAVRLASRDDFREKRAQLYRWQEEIIENDIPNDKAVREMEQYLKQYNDAVKRAEREVYWKFAFTVIPIGLSIAGATLVTPLVVAGGLVSLVKFVKFDRRPVIRAGECAAAAMFYDIRKSFKIEAG